MERAHAMTYDTALVLILIVGFYAWLIGTLQR